MDDMVTAPLKWEQKDEVTIYAHTPIDGYIVVTMPRVQPGFEYQWANMLGDYGYTSTQDEAKLAAESHFVSKLMSCLKMVSLKESD